MNNPELLSPALLNATAIVVLATGTLVIAVHALLLALAARRAELSPATQFSAPVAAAALLAVWFGWAVLAAKEQVIAPEPPLTVQFVLAPAWLATMALFAAASIGALFFSKTMRVLNAAMPPAWLIGAQTYRVAGAMFLWPYLAAGALPAGFAVPAGIGDVITGLAAPLVAWAVARNRPGARGWAVAWNLFGILDLVTATAAAVLSQSTNIGRFPLVVVPLFLGPPLGILTHIYSLRNLSANRENPPNRRIRVAVREPVAA